MGCDVPSISFAELPGNPVPPSSGRLKLFVLASNHEFYVINSAGSVSLLSSYVLSPALQSIESLEPIPADRFLYTNGTNTFNESPITLLARQLLAESTQGGMVTVIGAQPLSADLTAFVTNATWTGANLGLAGNFSAVDIECTNLTVDSNLTINLGDLSVGNDGFFGNNLTVGGTLTAGASVFNGEALFNGNIVGDANITASGQFNAPVYVVGSGPTITTGSGVPAAVQPDGSIYLRSGAPNGSLYCRENGVWVLK